MFFIKFKPYFVKTYITHTINTLQDKIAMKIRLTFILVMLMSITNALSQTKIDILTGETVDKTTPAVPQQTVETFDDGVRVTYTFGVNVDSKKIRRMW